MINIFEKEELIYVLNFKKRQGLSQSKKHILKP